MRKSLSLFAISILGILSLVIPFITLTAFKPLNQQNYNIEQQATGINETDFINTMFLRSTFFENWSETNYFINPTLKTSQTLTYNDKWYLDFLKDSYSTGISFDKSSDEFMDLYKNLDIYAKQYNIDKFYDVDKKQFLKELTNFSYSFAKYFNTVEVINKLEKSVDSLQQVNLKFQNWKLIDTNTSNWISNNEFPSNKNKWYIMFAILENESLLDLRLIKFKNDDINKPQSLGDKSNFIFLNNKKYWFGWLYRWDGTNEPETPTVDKDTGKVFFLYW